MPSPSPDFGRYAARYDELRPVDGNWWQLFDEIVRLGELRGARVLEVGCGTGRLAAGLEERALARVWAVDASAEMVARAKELGVNARVARAEALPFKAGWFDAVVMRMSLHLFDRPRAIAEAARVLAPGGRLVVATHDPASFDDVWFAQYFPSVAAVDGSRFPCVETLRAELPGVELTPLVQHRTLTRSQALDILRSQAYSTFELLPPDEYEQGLTEAEAELPATIDYEIHWLIAVAKKP